MFENPSLIQWSDRLKPMLFCSTNDAGYFLMQTQGLPKLKQFEIEVWSEKAKKILVRREAPGQQFLEV